MKRIEEFKLQIERLGSNGEGVGKSDGVTVFVPFCLVGETVLAQITKQKKSVADGKLKKILTSVNGRVSPPCAVFGSCGGCQLQHMNRSLQLNFKTQSVKNNLKKIAGLDLNVESADDLGSQYGYRNKLQIPLGMAGGKVVAGFFAEGSHRIVPTKTCPLHKNWADKIVETVTSFANDNQISAYDEFNKKGCLRHIVARYLSGQLLVSIVVNANELPHAQDLAARLEKEFEHFGLFVNINKSQTNVILGDKDIHIAGLTAIESRCLGIDFWLQQRSFFQVNQSVAEQIYLDVANAVKDAQTDFVVDAFSGIGVLSGVLAKQTGLPVYAVEIVPQAVEDAQKIKKANGLDNLTNICGDVNLELANILDSHKAKRPAVVVDPPRRGLQQQTIEAILQTLPQTLVYISCDSATLARDVKILSAKYAPKFCKAYDMFPQTKHVETLICLSLKS